MTTYDHKTEGAIESSGRFILPLFSECENATFKASYIVASDVICKGKIIALFDLIILGNIEATELDIKGKFVCLGNCEVSGSIVVQNEIWANNVRAESIETRDKIIAQDIDGDKIIADVGIIVGKTLAVEKFAKSEKNILCGETAFGAGKVAAITIITGEPLDLDGGEESVIIPSKYTPRNTNMQLPPDMTSATEPNDLFLRKEIEYVLNGNFRGYLDFLITISNDDDNKIKFARWKSILNEVETTIQIGIDEYTNVAILIWLSEIIGSNYFKKWDKISKLFNTFENHFKNLIQKDKNFISCIIGSYHEWLSALIILNRFGTLINSAIYNIAYELVISNLGLKAKFVSERLNEKGWEIHAEQ